MIRRPMPYPRTPEPKFYGPLARIPAPPRRLPHTSTAAHRSGAHSRRSPTRRTRRGRRTMASGGLTLLAVGAVILATSGGTSLTPPTPPRPTLNSQNSAVAAVHPSSNPTPSPAPKVAPGCKSQVVRAGDAQPLKVCIPAIGVTATVIRLGINPDHTLQVPTLKQVRDAGWDRYSPPPGDNGPTIIVGHIDSAQYGDGVFFNLGRLRPGNTVDVARADGAVAIFRIQRVAEYPKTAFPTRTVYGNTSGPTIRVITCGGRFDAKAGSYVDNIVAYGTLTSLG